MSQNFSFPHSRCSRETCKLFTKSESVREYSNIYPTRCNFTQFILSGNCSTCFGWYFHPSSGTHTTAFTAPDINPLKPELNPICYLLALLEAYNFLHVSRIRVKILNFRLLMSNIYGAPILDVSRSHTTTHHSR